jgi:hypothetical protein
MNLQQIKNIIKEQLDQLRYQKQTLNEDINCPESVQINCSNGTPCYAHLESTDYYAGEPCSYSDCCDEGPQSIIPKGPKAPMAYQNKRR